MFLLALFCLAGTAWADAEPVEVRFGRHADFGRLVFDWPAKVGYTVRQEGGSLVVTFARSGRFQARHPGLAGYFGTPAPADDGLSVTIPLSKPGFEVRDLKLGSRVVIDVSEPAEPKPEPAPAPTAEREAASAALAASVKKRVEAPLDLLPEPLAASMEDSSLAGKAPPSIAGPEAEEALVLSEQERDDPPLQLIDALLMEGTRSKPGPAMAKRAGPEARAQPTPKPAAEPAPKPAAEPAPMPAAKPAVKMSDASTRQSLELKSAPKGPALPALLPEPVEIDLVSRQELESPGPGGFSVGPMPGTLESAPAQPVFRLKWQTPSAAAAFVFAGVNWILIDRSAPADLEERLRELSPGLGELVRVPHPTATILQLPVSPLSRVRLSGSEGAWTVDTGANVNPAEQALAWERAEPEAVLAARLSEAAEPLRLEPSIAAEPLIVVPVKNAAVGQSDSRRFPEFDLLATATGVVVRPKRDDLTVRADGERLLIAHGGDQLSHERVAAAPPVEPEDGATEVERLLDLDAWRGQGNYHHIRERLLGDVTKARDRRSRLAAHLALARFTFAHGLLPEAGGMLELAVEDAPRLADDPSTRLMRAAESLMSGKWLPAAAQLRHPSLLDEPEGQLWQGALAAMAGEWGVAARLFAAGEPLIGAYPDDMRTRLALMAAESRLRIGDSGGASLVLDRLAHDPAAAKVSEEIGFLSAWRDRLDGREVSAIEKWEQVAGSDNAPTAARARLALVQAGLASETMAPGEALAELERLRFAWRGDAFELSLLMELSYLYRRTGDFRSALEVLRQAVTFFPEDPRSERAVDTMKEIFAAAFLEDEGRSLSPLRALGLYREFRELMPTDDRGERILMALTDRLVEMDLLDQADEVLETSLGDGEAGAKRLRLETKLALIRYLNGREEDAIAVLAPNEDAEMPDALRLRRDRLAARALLRLERPDEALERLAGDETAEGVRLRADIFLNRRDWPLAAAQLERLVAPVPPERPLTDAESQAVLDLAASLTLSEETERLAALAVAYASAMKATTQGKEFAFLTEGLDMPVPDQQLSELGE